MQFFKYHAAGNDFIITKEQNLDSEKIKKLCNRNFGIGADGVLIHKNSTKADAKMEIVNNDGSSAEMCGNGLRCFVSYLVTECGMTKKKLMIETGKGEQVRKENAASSGVSCQCIAH